MLPRRTLRKGIGSMKRKILVLARITSIHFMLISTPLHISEAFTGSFSDIIVCYRDGFPLQSTIESSMKWWWFLPFLIAAATQAG